MDPVLAFITLFVALAAMILAMKSRHKLAWKSGLWRRRWQQLQCRRRSVRRLHAEASKEEFDDEKPASDPLPGRVGMWLLCDETFKFLKTDIVGGGMVGNSKWLAAKTQKLQNNVFVAQLFFRPTVVSVDAAFNRFVLSNEGRLFCASYPPSVVNILGPFSLVALHGEPHRKMRSYALAFSAAAMNASATVFAAARSSAFLCSLHTEVLRTLSSWPSGGAADSGIVLAYQQVKQFTFNVMVRQMLSLSPDEPDSVFLQQHYRNFMRGLVSLPINLPGTAYRRAFNSKDKIMKKLDEIITARRAASSSNHQRQGEAASTAAAKHIEVKFKKKRTKQRIRTSVEATAEEEEEEERGNQIGRTEECTSEEEGKRTAGEAKEGVDGGGGAGAGDDFLQFISGERGLGRKEVLDLMLSLLFAGHETSSVALSLCILFLAHSPAQLQRLREEHRAIRLNNLKLSVKTNLTSNPSNQEEDDTMVSWDDYKAMEYTQYVIKETLRLGNIVRFVHREAKEDVTYGEYRIPKGWQVLPIFVTPHLDQELYDDPLRFQPERWQSTEKKVPYFTPFGGGIRLCAGMEFAKLEMAVFLHHLVLNYDWSLVDSKVEMGSTFAFVDFPNGLPIRVRRLNHFD